MCHVSPTYFAVESCLGGGERFAEELARAMAERARVKFVSFGPRFRRERAGPRYERVILRRSTRDAMVPFSPRFWGELHGADVVHCHQEHVLSTFASCLSALARRQKVFVSDLGGGGWTPAARLDQERWITGHLPISRYAAGLSVRRRPSRVIHGGVDLRRYPMRSSLDHDGSVVFLGRVLPHKGIHHLVEAVPQDVDLHVVGTVKDHAYATRLRTLAEGKRVAFREGLGDREIRAILSRAMVLVHPTPVDEAGSAGVNELFGLALVEAMACGCPVIASDVASLPEIVVHGETGLLVPPNDPKAIRDALRTLREDFGRWRRFSLAGRTRVENEFTWSRVVDRCLDAYRTLGTPS